MFLVSVLHFYDEVVALVGGAINVIYNASHVLQFRQLFFVLEGDVGNVVFASQQVVKKAYKP